MSGNEGYTGCGFLGAPSDPLGLEYGCSTVVVLLVDEVPWCEDTPESLLLAEL